MNSNEKKSIGFEIRILSNLIRRHINNSASHAETESVTGMNGWVIVYLAHNRVETEKLITDGIPEEELAMFISVAERMKQNLEKCDGEMGPGDGPSCLGKGKKI